MTNYNCWKSLIILLFVNIVLGLNAKASSQTKQFSKQIFKTMKESLQKSQGVEKASSFLQGSASNPYILACNSSDQCQDTVLKDCEEVIPSQPNTWYCNCFCDGFGPCTTNRDCCNNKCSRNGVCTADGGPQGAVCSLSGKLCSQCQSSYRCTPWGTPSDTGFCNFYNALNGTNPFTYIGCPNGTSDCQGTMYHTCNYNNDGPIGSYCRASCNGGPCKENKDCYNNECNDGTCTFKGGEQGTGCTLDGRCSRCSSGYFCYPWPPSDDPNFGYCQTMR